MSVRSGGLRTRNTILRKLDVPVERPYIVLALAWWGNNLIDHAIHRKSMKMLAEALPNDAVLAYKLHPSHEEPEFCHAVLSASLPRAAFRILGESECSMVELLDACDVAVMHITSMSLADAIVMGRPAIAIEHDEFPCVVPSIPYHVNLNHPAWSIGENCWRVRDSAELRRALMMLTHDETARNALLKHRGSYIEEFLVAPDGRSAARVADLIEHLGAGESPASFLPTIEKSVVPDS
jgi:hypothetical protein